MNISVIGCGYLGAAHAAAMAEIGHNVVGVDVDSSKIAKLAAGEAPFVEPGLDALLAAHTRSGKLTFSTDYSAVRECDLHFICVGTPQARGADNADLSSLDAAVQALVSHAKPGSVVVGKSTVPVGTAATLDELLRQTGLLLVWNPEFLREGFAIQDTLEPDRIVYGLPSESERASAAMAALDLCYRPLLEGCPRLTMDFATAELVKVSANAFLATKISFINAMSQACDASGADVTKLAQAIGLDARIGSRFLNAGIGFGGGCLPKDIKAFRARSAELGVGEAFEFLADVERINLAQRIRAVDILETLLDGLEGKRVTVLGAAFKPESDDIRESPSLAVSAIIAKRGAHVRVTDPVSGHSVMRANINDIEFVEDFHEALRGADAVFLGTEWKMYRQADPKELASLVTTPIIVDGRNVLDPEKWKEAGWTYRGIGRR